VVKILNSLSLPHLGHTKNVFIINLLSYKFLQEIKKASLIGYFERYTISKAFRSNTCVNISHKENTYNKNIIFKVCTLSAELQSQDGGEPLTF